MDGPYPGCIGRRSLEDLAGLVVGLEDGEGIDHALGAEEEHETRGYLGLGGNLQLLDKTAIQGPDYSVKAGHHERWS